MVVPFPVFTTATRSASSHKTKWTKLKSLLTSPRSKVIWGNTVAYVTAFVTVGGGISTFQMIARYCTKQPSLDVKVDELRDQIPSLNAKVDALGLDIQDLHLQNRSNFQSFCAYYERKKAEAAAADEAEAAKSAAK